MGELFLGLRKSGAALLTLLFFAIYVLFLVSILYLLKDNKAPVGIIDYAWVNASYIILLVMMFLFFGLIIAFLLFQKYKLANVGIAILSGYIVITSAYNLIQCFLKYALNLSVQVSLQNAFEIVAYSCLFGCLAFVLLCYLYPKHSILLRTFARIISLLFIAFKITAFVMLCIVNNNSVREILEATNNYILYPIVLVIVYANLFDPGLEEELLVQKAKEEKEKLIAEDNKQEE